MPPYLTMVRELIAARSHSLLHCYFSQLGRSYADNWKWHALPICLVVGMALLTGCLDSALRYLVVISLAELVVRATALFFLVTRPALRFHRLLEAESWHRWHDVLRLLPSLHGELPNELSILFEAKALAGLGRLDEALKLLLPFATNGEIPPAKYWSLLVSGVYRAAQRPDLALAAQEKAIELAPDDPLTLIGAAIDVVDQQGDTRRARELLRRATLEPVSDTVAKFALIVEGMIATEDGNARLAVEKLEAGLKAQRQSAKGNAKSASLADIFEGGLALAKAMAGDLIAARKHFRRAEPRLRARRYEKLLARCQQALHPKL